MQKGEIGETQVMTDLMRKGYEVLVPFSESLPFDLAVHKDGRFGRIQVKYRAKRDGCVEADIRRMQPKEPRRAMKDHEIDYVAIFCPDNGETYYVDFKKMGTSIKIRIDEPERNSPNINYAEDFRELNF